jgi:pSer/pThr/pTyr-binding forkhead associated (FHA) protein
MLWLTPDQWTAVGSIAGILAVGATLLAWYRPRAPKDNKKEPNEQSRPTLKVSGLRIVQAGEKGPSQSRIVKIFPGQSYTIGRLPDNDIVLRGDDLTVSRHHAKLVAHDDYVEVIDLGATNPLIFPNDPAEQEYGYARIELNGKFQLGEAVITVVAG